jgi:tetratricopeptide (TPR) repeat protein
MGILANIRRGYYDWRYDVREAKRIKAATKPANGELFNISGYGPRKPADALVAAPYKGPMYPAPSYDKYSPAKPQPYATKTAMSWCNRARQAWSEKNLTVAEEAYESALRLCPDNPDFLFEEAQLLWSQQRLQEARDRLKRALDIEPRFVSARASYLRICVILGDKSTLASDFSALCRFGDDLGLEHLVGDEVRPALGISNN